MKVLVTGGAGYIGQVLVRKLLEYGVEVRVVDTFYFPPGMVVQKGLELIRGDICQPKEEWFEGIDAVSHLAGFSNDPTADADPERNSKVNHSGTAYIGSFARAAGIKKFVYASSASIYDRADASLHFANEESPVYPVGHYSVSKHRGEEALIDMANNDFQPIIFRQGTVFGDSPRMRFDLVVKTMMRSALQTGVVNIHGDGSNWRPLISVDNLAAAHLAVLMMPAGSYPGGIYNLLDSNHTVKDVAREVVAGVELATSLRPRIQSIPFPDGLRQRNYKISGVKFIQHFGEPLVTSIRYFVQGMAMNWAGRDMSKPEYENITWMSLAGANTY